MRRMDEAVALDRLDSTVREWITAREGLRATRRFAEADALRDRIAAAGYRLEDHPAGTRVFACTPPSAISSASPPEVPLSIQLLAEDPVADTIRALDSVRRWTPSAFEMLVIDNVGAAAAEGALEAYRASAPDLRIIRLPDTLGWAAARNAGLRAARGEFIVVLDSSVELSGDAITPLVEALRDPTVGLVGPWGVRTADLRSFQETDAAEVDAMQGYCMAFRRDDLPRVGYFDETFRFYRHADLDFSFAFRSAGLRVAAVPGLPLRRHPHAGWLRLPEAERARLSKRNYYRFLEKWRDRSDLLVGARHAVGASGRPPSR